MESNRFWRQLDICPPEKLAFPITVIGAGAIGSAVVAILAKMGCGNITVWDEDVLSEHNIPNQMCLTQYVGSPKVDALAHLVEMLCEVEIKPLCSNYHGQRLDGVVIAAVDSIVGWPPAVGMEPIKPPPPPKEFANVFSVGYGQGDAFPADPAEFEQLLVNLKGAGYNVIHCVYRDWRVELCRKHGMKMMIDILAWHEGAKTDVRWPEQQKTVMEICKKVRGDEAVWGYNLWNRRLDRFVPGGIAACNGLLVLLRKWDPSHPVWVGTYFNFFAGVIQTNPGCYAYYDYHWQRGMHLHFGLLKSWVEPFLEERDAYLGRWMLGLDYNRCMYTLNTSLSYGLKTGIWFICGPWHPANPKWDDNHFLCRIGREMYRLWPEIGKIGRPIEVYSTPTTKTAGNKDKAPGLPTGVPIPEDFWFKVTSGEVLVGHFKYDDENDALYVSNHNAFAPQKVAMAFKGKDGKAVKVEMFDRKTGEWKQLELKNGSVAFDLGPGGGEMLRTDAPR